MVPLAMHGAGTSSPSVRQILLGCLIAASFIAYHLGTGSYIVPKWLLLVLFAAVAGLAAAAALWRRRALTVDGIDLVAALTWGWIAASWLWTPDRLAAVVIIGCTFAGLIVFLTVRRLDRRLALRILSLGCAIAIALGLLMAIALPEERNAGFGNENMATGFFVGAVPLALSGAWLYPIRFGAPMAALAAAGAIYLLVGNDSKLEFVAWGWLLPVLPAFLFKRLRNRILAGTAILLVLMILGAASVPRIWESHLRESVMARAEFYHNTLALWLDRPLIGAGAGSFEYLYPRYQFRHLERLPDYNYSEFKALTDHIATAHSDVLQSLAEFGLVGFALLATIVLLALSATPDNARREPAVWLAAAAAISLAVLAGIDFPTRNAASFSLLAASLALCSPVPAHGRGFGTLSLPLHRTTRFVALAAAVAITGVAGVMAFRAYVAETNYNAARQYRETEPARALRLYGSAFNWFPYSTQYRVQLAYSLGRYVEKGLQPTVKADDADYIHAVARSAIPDDPHLQLLRLRYLDTTDRATAEAIDTGFAKLLRQMPQNLDVRLWEIEYLLGRTRLDEARRKVHAALTLSERIAGQHRQADRLRADRRTARELQRRRTQLQALEPQRQ